MDRVPRPQVSGILYDYLQEWDTLVEIYRMRLRRGDREVIPWFSLKSCRMLREMNHALNTQHRLVRHLIDYILDQITEL